MIEIKENKNKFIECIGLLPGLVVETDITFGQEGIFIKAVHPSNHCMLILKISKDLFEKYEFESDITYTIQMEELLKILSCLKNDTLIISNQPDYIDFKDGRRHFKLNYFVGSKDVRPVPEFEHKFIFDIDSKEFFNNTADCLTFDQIGNYQIQENKLKLNSKSHMIKGTFDLAATITNSGECQAYFDLSYIALVKGLKNLFKDVNVRIDNDLPLIIKGNNALFDAQFILANRVGEENE